MSGKSYNVNVGDYLVITITDVTGTYVAEIVQPDPLQLKVEETGPYAHLKSGDFIILDGDTAQFQRDLQNNTSVFLETEQMANRHVHTGLKSLGADDGKLCEILPGEGPFQADDSTER
jgi:hypothetical protein